MTAGTLGQWSLPELSSRLGEDGIMVHMNPFVVHVRSSIPVVAQGLHLLHARQRCVPGGQGFADFRVEVRAASVWPRAQCRFSFDGHEPFTPLARHEAYALLEWGVNWCVSTHCHQWVILHAAVLERNGQAVVLPAPPGSGKSTLCAALMIHGWRLLSDELALLDPQTGLLTPCPRPISLKNRSIDVIRERDPSLVFGPLAKDTVKGTVCHLRPSDHSIDRATQRVAPAWVVFPQYVADAPLSFDAVRPAAALMALQHNAFNRHVHGHAGFHALSDLVERCQTFSFRYGMLDEALAWFDSLAAQAGAA